MSQRVTPPAVRVIEHLALAYRRTWRFSATSSFVSPVLFLLAMGVGLGSLVDERAAPSELYGLSYLSFVAPALLATTAMQSAANEASFPVLAAIKWTPMYPAMLATPIGVRDLAVGQLTWIGMRLAITCTPLLLVITAFGVVESPLALLALPAAVLTGMAFATPIAAFSTTIERETNISTLLRFGIMPMFLFSGSFFPIEELPDGLEAVARALPLWHGVDLCRSLVLGDVDGAAALGHVLYLTAIAALGWWLSMQTFRKRLVR